MFSPVVAGITGQGSCRWAAVRLTAGSRLANRNVTMAAYMQAQSITSRSSEKQYSKLGSTAR